jgi:gas vesicle protein
MIHDKSKHSYLDLFEGMIIGGTLAAAATFIFGTKKGKELQKELVHQYKKLGHTTKKMRSKIEHAINLHTAKKLKQSVKKKVKKVKSKIKTVKRRASRKAA